MRIFAAILLLMPLTVIGYERSKEPYGLWKCKTVSVYSCELRLDLLLQPGWNDVKPDCESPDHALDWDADEATIYFDLRSSDYTFTLSGDLDKYPMKHIDNWVFGTTVPVEAMGYLYPDINKWAAHLGTMHYPDGYTYMEGTCTNITDQEPEKPTEGESKD